MEVIVTETSRLGAVAADTLAPTVLAGGVLGLATGSSPLPVYRELIRRHREDGLDFSQVRAFLLDEYVGLPAGHPQAYRSVIQREFTDHVGLGEVHGPDGDADDLMAAAERYEAAIVEAGGIDVQLLGIGTDGHLGFNEPTSSLQSRTRIKTLTQQTRLDNARFFGAVEAVPHHVLTQGLGTICDARRLVLVATGSGKAEAVATAVEGPLSAFCPASVLQWHPHATVILDEAAAARLRLLDYYRFVQTHKPPLR